MLLTIDARNTNIAFAPFTKKDGGPFARRLITRKSAHSDAINSLNLVVDAFADIAIPDD